MSDELAFAPALELAARVRARELSPVDLAELYLERIDRLDPQLNAYVTVVEDPAPPRDGPFYGVPIPIKDLNETAGIRTTYSCKAFARNVPDFDASVVRKIRDELGIALPALLVSGDIGSGAERDARMAGLMLLPKPVVPAVLQAIATALIARA